MKRFDFDIVRNCYGDVYVPYEIAKVMNEKGYKANRKIESDAISNNIAFYLNGNLTTYACINTEELSESFETVDCPTVHEAMKWVNETMRTYVNIEVTVDDACDPVYYGNIVKLPHIEDCDQGWPSEYVTIINDRDWHCCRNNECGEFEFMTTDIVRYTEDELLLDVLVYLLNIR